MLTVANWYRCDYYLTLMRLLTPSGRHSAASFYCGALTIRLQLILRARLYEKPRV